MTKKILIQDDDGTVYEVGNVSQFDLFSRYGRADLAESIAFTLEQIVDEKGA